MIRTYAYGQAIDDTADDEHADILGGRHENWTDAPAGIRYRRILEKSCLPYQRSYHNWLLSAENVWEVTWYYCSKPWSASHGGCDSTLCIWMRSGASESIIVTRAIWALIKITEVWLSANDSTHGRYIKTEQATANHGDGCNEVNISSSVHRFNFYILTLEYVYWRR